MASRHHHHHHHDQSCLHHNNIPLFATSPHCCIQLNHPSPPPESNLLHLVASYLQNQQQETQCSCETQFHNFNGVRHQQKNVSKQREYDDLVLSCLLRKIDDLESSLNKFSAFYNQRRDRSSTLRDSAARVIQTHFRSYLVHRSIFFRQLKKLAMIKSSFLSLKSSISGKPYFPFKAVSRKATDLLLQLDSIQGRIDPMIRSSKRSLSRDLVRFLKYIDDCAIKRFDFVGESAINGKKPQGLGVAEKRPFDELRKLMEKVVVTSSCDEDNNADITDDSEEVLMNVIDKRKIGSTKSRTGRFVKPQVRKSVVFDKKRNTLDLTSSAEDDDSVEGDEETLMIPRDNENRCNLKGRKEVLVKGSGVKTNQVVKTVRFDKNGNVYKANGDSSAEDNSVDSDEETFLVSRDNGRKRNSKARNVVLVKGSGGKTNRVVKTVSFDENGNVYKANGDSSAEDNSVDSDEETFLVSRDNGRKRNSKARNVVLVKESGGKTNRVVKTVSFDENGNVYKVYGDTPELSITEEDDSTSGSNDGNGNGNEVEEIKYVPKEKKGFEKEEEETHSEDEVSSSEGSEEIIRNVNHSESKEQKKEIQLQKGSLMFSPPLPLKMEP